MAGDVTRPQDVLADDLREELKKAVIAAYMATNVIGDAEGHSIKRWVQLTEEGDGFKFHYEANILGEDYPVSCAYPSGDWDLENPGPNLGDYPGFTAIDATGRWEELKADVDLWLHAWVNDNPDPNAFTNQINSIARIGSQLNIGGTAGGDGAPGGDTDLREAVSTITNRSFGQGRAMTAFRDAYASDLWTTITGQCGATAAAGVALTAEGAAWSETYRSVRQLIQVSIGDFYSLAGTDGKNETSAAVLGATSAVAGLLGATAGVAFPPLASRWAA